MAYEPSKSMRMTVISHHPRGRTLPVTDCRLYRLTRAGTTRAHTCLTTRSRARYRPSPKEPIRPGTTRSGRPIPTGKSADRRLGSKRAVGPRNCYRHKKEVWRLSQMRVHWEGSRRSRVRPARPLSLRPSTAMLVGTAWSRTQSTILHAVRRGQCRRVPLTHLARRASRFTRRTRM
jgi:hypothetical protein